MRPFLFCHCESSRLYRDNRDAAIPYLKDEIAEPVPKRKRGISLLAKTERMSLRVPTRRDVAIPCLRLEIQDLLEYVGLGLVAAPGGHTLD